MNAECARCYCLHFVHSGHYGWRHISFRTMTSQPPFLRPPRLRATTNPWFIRPRQRRRNSSNCRTTTNLLSAGRTESFNGWTPLCLRGESKDKRERCPFSPIRQNLQPLKNSPNKPRLAERLKGEEVLRSSGCLKPQKSKPQKLISQMGKRLMITRGSQRRSAVSVDVWIVFTQRV